MISLRVVCGVGRVDQVRNNRVRILSMVEISKESVLKWIGHMERKRKQMLT